MAFYLKFDGAGYTTAATLGDLTAVGTIQVTAKKVRWASTTGYLFSQSGSTARELGLWRDSSGLNLYYGGVNKQLVAAADFTTAFGGSTIEGDLTFDLVVGTGEYTLTFNGTVVANATVIFGTGRQDGVLFRLGARSSSDTAGDTTGTYKMAAGDYTGDVTVTLDGVLVRNYVMPGTGSTITDSVAANNATLRNFPTDDSQWVSYGGKAGIPAGLVKLDGSAQLNLTNVHYRVLAGAGLKGAEYFNTTTGTTDGTGTRPALDCSASVGVIGDAVTLQILTADGKGTNVTTTLQDIA